MPSAISSTVGCMGSMPGWRSARRDPVHSGLNDPADLVTVVGFVGAVQAGADPPVERPRPPSGSACGDLGDRGAQRPGDVEAGALGRRRRPPAPARRGRTPGRAGRRAGRARPARPRPSRAGRHARASSASARSCLDAVAVGRPGACVEHLAGIAEASDGPTRRRGDALDAIDQVEDVALDAGQATSSAR